MKRRFALLAAVSVLLCTALPAEAVLQRVYVSAIVGNDANTATGCPATAPCRWFSTAVGAVDAGGEVVAIDSGAYGTVTTNKSVSIIAPDGVYAGITVFSGDGVTIATPSVNVRLRGLSFNGMGGTNGVNMTNGSSLTVERCTFRNFTTGDGILVSTSAQVRIVDSLLQANKSGMEISSGAKAAISSTRVLDNTTNGILVSASGGGQTTEVDIFRSEVNGNGNAGIYSAAGSSGTVELNVRESQVTLNNWVGIDSEANSATSNVSVSTSLVSGNGNCGLTALGTGATMVATGNSVLRNFWGLCQVSSGVLKSTGDNTLDYNAIQTYGTITPLSRY
jgi:hypothetical protein